MEINNLLSPGLSLKEVPGGHEVTYKGRRLTAPSEPRLVAEKKVAQFNILPNSILFLPSPLLFYGVSALLNSLPQDCLIFFGEEDGTLRNLAERVFPREIRRDPRIHPKIIGSISELSPFLGALSLHSFRRIQTLSLTGGYALAAKTYREWEDAIRRALMQYWRNRAALAVMGRRWIENLITNIPMLDGGRPLGEFGTEKPLIVAGAGESLEHALPFLRENRRAFFLSSPRTPPSPSCLKGG